MLKIFSSPLFAHDLYSRAFSLIFIMWDYFSIFMYAGDVGASGAFDYAIKSRSSIVT